MKTALLGCGLFLLVMTSACHKNKEATPPAGQPPTQSAGGNPLTAPVDYLGGIANAKRLAERTVDLAAVNNAIQLFNAQEERLPRDLNELVERRYLPALPAAPAGMRMIYNPATGELKMVRQ